MRECRRCRSSARSAARPGPRSVTWTPPAPASKGGKPHDKKLRGLAWVATRWAAEVRPAVIGNSVSPMQAEALVRANVRAREAVAA